MPAALAKLPTTKKRESPISAAKAKRAVRHYQKGMAVPKIATRLGVSISTVYRALRAAGATKTSRSPDRKTLPKQRPLTFCTHCGTRRGKDWAYCGGCGTRVAA